MLVFFFLRWSRFPVFWLVKGTDGWTGISVRGPKPRGTALIRFFLARIIDICDDIPEAQDPCK